MNAWVNNHVYHFGNTIQVIFYQDEIDYDAIPPSTAIYLCAHGSSSDELKLYNHSNLDVSESISMEETAMRFSSDFLFIHYKIQDLHLYCCGSKEKNHALAQLIQSNLPAIQENRIHYYQGSLTSAAQNGELFSIMGSNWLPVAQVKSTVPRTREQEINEEGSTASSKFYLHYLSTRRPCSDHSKAERQERRRQNFFEESRAHRQLDIINNRRQCTKMEWVADEMELSTVFSS
ncbi:hypothetical protein DIZ81_13705 [Legionella taurinensis]|uniref:Uncharacterized protein n=1 Tax=Legionella taurinensis TaxID=70611 RepID=A0A3A5LIF5_9GAMM|nr:hypothetical protein [Legionella taurinensis]PUT38586.1 hypothetical protein DB744_13715 [Legionella taurinensis]PUT39495.1 hypothetical protein DB746_13725 [Legionella taurinensis]PUT41633.1 hypothetical protein DB743_13705 [Legionella taurinensis]PUT44998.1 hypothetical protein DB745_13665 [Legionella taurinensis]RJT47685.1 hypothetical protein D6J04_05970 [Legionella taurinensis]